MRTICASSVSRADSVGAHQQAAGAVDRAADDLGARLLLHRDRLARDHRLVHGAAALRRPCRPPAPSRRAARAAGRRAGPAPGGRLPPGRRAAPRGRSSGARPSSLRMAPLVWLRARTSSTCPSSTSTVTTAAVSKYGSTPPCRAEAFREQPRGHRGRQAVEVSSADAQGDQGEHVRAAVDDRGPGAFEERPAAPQHDRRGQDQLHPVEHLPCPGVQRPARAACRPWPARRSAGSGPGRSRSAGSCPPVRDWGLPRRDGARLQGHAALRAAAGMVAHDLRMHGTGVDRAGGRRRSGGGAGQVACRVRPKPLQAVRAAKVECLPVMHMEAGARAGSTVMPQTGSMAGMVHLPFGVLCASARNCISRRGAREHRGVTCCCGAAAPVPSP